jgi:hypothetical protein
MPSEATPTRARSAQKTQPRCKVCQHPQRVDIELALLEGQSRELIAQHFSTSDRPLNRQNLHTHDHKHMDTVDRAVVDKARARTRNALLDIQTARGIRDQEDELLDLLYAHTRTAIAEGRVRVSVRDIIHLNQERARIEQERANVQIEAVMIQARTYGKAVKNIIHEDSTHRQILNEYDRLMAQNASDSPEPADMVTGA